MTDVTMKSLVGAALCLGLSGNVLAAPADQPKRPGNCFFKVDRKVIMKGRCDIQLDPSEPTYIQIYKPKGEWVANAIGKWSTWNHWHETKVGLDGKPAIFGGTTDYPLGKMTRNGNCWRNKRATLCGEVSP